MKKTLGLSLILLFLGSPGLFANEDFDAEVEESMAESDANSVQAHWAKQRAIKEQEEAERLKREGAVVKANAKVKLKKSARELANAEVRINAAKVEQAKHRKERAAVEKQVAVAEAKLKTALAKLQKVKAENSVIAKARDDQQRKLAQLNKERKNVDANTAKLNRQIAQGKKDIARAKAETAAAELKLKNARAEQAKRKMQANSQTETLKAIHRENNKKLEEAEASRAPASMAPKPQPMVLTRECSIYDQPDRAAGKALGSQPPGTRFVGQKQEGWLSYRTKGGRTLFVPADCF